MALTLQQMRDYLRTHLDLEVEDLPDQLIDAWAREGSKRVERAEARWPHFEKFYTFTFDVNASGLYPFSGIGGDLDQIANIVYGSGNFPPIHWIGIDAFQEMLAARPSATGRPEYYSTWNDNVTLFPTPDVSYNTTIRGYRSAVDWVAAGAGGTPDLPDELHNTVMTWALSKAYAQQEDPEMASFYERQFADELNEMRRRLVIAPQQQPLVLNSGHLRGESLLRRPRFDWEVS